MSDYQHFMSFYLTDPKTNKKKHLTDDFDGIIINTNEETYDRECMPQMNFITDKNDTRDGEIFIKGNYGVRVIDMTILIKQNSDLLEFKRWIGKKYQQLFEWDGDDEDKAIWVILSNKLESKVYYQKEFYAKFELSFTCHNPYYFINKKEEIPFNNLVAGNSKNIGYRGNCDGYPLLNITPTTTNVTFQWNDLTVVLSNLTIGRIYYLDCEKCQCYYISNNIKILCASNYYSNKYIDYPSILCEGANTLTVISGGMSILINPRSRII